jgi:hypothetical protein
VAAFQWMAGQASPEWMQLFARDLIAQMRRMDCLGELVQRVRKVPLLQRFLTEYQKLLDA